MTKLLLGMMAATLVLGASVLGLKAQAPARTVWSGVSAGGTRCASPSRSAPHPQTPPPSETEFRPKVRDETEFRHEERIDREIE